MALYNSTTSDARLWLVSTIVPGNHSLCQENSSNQSSSNMTKEDGTYDVAHYRIFRIVVDVFLVLLVCLVGFIGNALSIAVLQRDRDKKNTTTWILQTLAVADSIYLFFCLFMQPLVCLKNLTNWFPGLKTALPYMEPAIWPLASISQTITVWLVILVTADRYIAICKPLATQMRSLHRAKIAVLLVVIIAVIYNVPRFFERAIEHSTDHCTGEVTVEVVKTSMRKSKHYFLIYMTVMHLICRTMGPLLILFFLNINLIRALQQVKRKHKDLAKKSKNHENITLMLIVVVSIFIMCLLPDLVIRLIMTFRKFIPSLTINIWHLRYLNSMTNFMLTLNSAINFLIYCLIGKKFRRILANMCCQETNNKQVLLHTDVSESEPLTTKTNIMVSRNGIATAARDGDIQL